MAGKRFARGARRLTTWLQFQPQATTLGAGGSSLVFSLNAAALAARPFTVVRSHFEVALQSDQAAAVEVQAAGFGIAVVSDQAVAIGVTAIPTPITEAGSHLWFVHQFCFADESNLTDRTRSGGHWSIDSKAMRKVDVGSDIVVVFENDTLVGSIMRIAGRMLVKNN